MKGLFDNMDDTLFKGVNVFDLLPDNYPDVTEDEAIIIITLAIYGRIYGKGVLYDNVRKIASCHLASERYYNNKIKDVLEGMLQKKIVKQFQGYYWLNPQYIKGVPQKALSNKTFEEAVSGFFLSDTYEWRITKEQMRFCILTKRHKCGEYKLELQGYNSCLNTFIGLIVETEDISCLDINFLREIDSDITSALEIIFSFLPATATMVDNTIEWYLKLNDSDKQLSFYSVMSYLALYGTPSQIEQMISERLKNVPGKDTGIKNISFVADLLKGNIREAKIKGDAFKLYLNDINMNRKKEMPLFLGCFYAIILFLSDNASESKQALTYVRATKKYYKDLDLTRSPVFEITEILREYFSEKQSGENIALGYNNYQYNSKICTLWINTLLTWEGRVNNLKAVNWDFITQNPRLELEMRACGFQPEEENEEEAQRRISSLTKELGMRPLCYLTEPEPKWKEILKIFEGIEGTKSAEAPKTEERLVWRVNFETSEIVPYYQKLQKAGWSKGRNIALRTLYSSTPKYATDTDVQIINQLKREDGWCGVEYNWNYPKCLPLLVNHPLLFTTEDPMLPVELKEKEAELIVKENGDEIQISINADLENCIVKEGERRYKYLVWNKSVRQIATLMKNDGVKTVKFPREAKKKTLEALSKVSKRVPVSGDFDDPNLIKKKSKNIPVIRMQPAGNHFVVSVLIKPETNNSLTLLPGTGADKIIYRSEKGERVQISRNLKKELKVLQELKATVPALLAMDDNEIDLEDGNDILQFLSDVKEFVPKAELQWPKGETLRVASVVSVSDFNINIKSNTDWFEVNGNIRIDDKKVWSIRQLLEASAGGSKSFIQLDNSTYVKLKKDLQKRLKELASMGQETKDGLQIHKLAVNALSEVVDSAGKSTTDKAWKDNLKNIERLRHYVPELPGNLHAELRPYQLEGYNWLSRLHEWGVGACLADDMGLGKTVQAIALMLKGAENGADLVIAPSSVCANWHNEIHRFAPVLQTVSLGINNREETLKSLKAYDVLIVSYGLIQSNPDLLADTDWNIVVLDEAHAIKNAQSIRSKAVMKLRANFRMITTGTPVQNHLGELWNLFQFITPGFLGSYDNFMQRFVNGSSEKEIVAKRKVLNHLITPFILRRNKSEVIEDLPEKTEITLTVEQSEDEKAYYEVLRQKAVAEIEQSGSQNSHIEILAQLTKLRLASCNLRLVDAASNISSSKLKALEDLIDDLLSSKHKALVFSQFTKHLALIREMLDKKGVTYQYLDGSTSMPNREKVIRNFQSGKSDLFLISLRAGGTGLNLTAADYVIHMDPWWNPAIEDQASDRAHRIGQTRPVTVYRLISEGTIEEKIMKLHHDKRDLADQILSNTDRSAKISSAELFELMK